MIITCFKNYCTIIKFEAHFKKNISKYQATNSHFLSVYRLNLFYFRVEFLRRHKLYTHYENIPIYDGDFETTVM